MTSILPDGSDGNTPRPPVTLAEQMAARRDDCEHYAAAYAQRALESIGRTPPDYGGFAMYASRASAAHLCAVEIQRGLDGES